jgi:diacylglycerol kinase (ATP)
VTIALLANPAARSGAGVAPAERAAERLRAAGLEVAMVSGGSAAESTRLLRAALDLDATAVVVAGGDGTVHLAIQEVAGTGIPLGIIPVGTGNDMAAVAGLRELDPDAAADAIVAGQTRDIDLARVTRGDGTAQLFGTVLASGFDARVNDRANAMRWPRGGSRYNIAILIEFLQLHGVPFRLDLELADGAQESLSGELVMVTVGNGRTYGGGIPICPDADPADGLLDVTLVRPAGRLHLLRLLPRVYKGTHTSLEEVSTRRVRSIRLESAGVTAYADGDPIGELPLLVDVVPSALRLFARR